MNYSTHVEVEGFDSFLFGATGEIITEILGVDQRVFVEWSAELKKTDPYFEAGIYPLCSLLPSARWFLACGFFTHGYLNTCSLTGYDWSTSE